MNASTYRSEVGMIIGDYFNREQQYEFQWRMQEEPRKYKLPSWAPRPGHCDLGVRMTTTSGTVACVRPHRGTA